MRCLRLQDLEVGQGARQRFFITQADMEAFARLSGDRNPLHRDAVFAGSKGFRRPIVYGGLLVAKISGLLGMELPGRNGIWYSLQVGFHRPLYVGEWAVLYAEVQRITEAVRLVSLRLTVESGARTVARGTAEVVLAHG